MATVSATSPAEVMPCAGMAPPWADTKSMRPKLRLCTRGWAAISKARCTAAGDSMRTWIGTGAAEAFSSARSAASTSSTDSTLGTMMWLSRWPASPAIVATSLANAGGSTAGTRGATRGHGAPGCSPQGQPGPQPGVAGFKAGGGAVFAIEGDIKDAGTELLRHLGLQLQALAHARFDAAVVVTDRQEACLRLGAQQHIAWMGWRSALPLRGDPGGPKARCLWRRLHGAHLVYSRCLTPSCSPCSSASVMLMRSCENASISRPSTILYSPFSHVTGKPNMVSLGMPYWPSEGMPMVTHLPLVPRAQSRMWSMAALAAEAADDRPRASMMAAPRLPTVGRKVLAFHSWSLIILATLSPLMVAKR